MILLLIILILLVLVYIVRVSNNNDIIKANAKTVEQMQVINVEKKEQHLTKVSKLLFAISILSLIVFLLFLSLKTSSPRTEYDVVAPPFVTYAFNVYFPLGEVSSIRYSPVGNLFISKKAQYTP